MKYMGPFLKISTLTKESIQNQLIHFSKESLKHIILNSKCGITTPINSYKLKNIPNFDINIFKRNSPLLCVYKKANPKLIKEKDSFSWDESTFKREIPITANAYMTLSIIKLANYYLSFKDTDTNLYALGELYSQLAIKQLDFYSSSLRSVDGLFVDKADTSESSSNIKVQEITKKFKFSDQALLMCAYYNASKLKNNEDSSAYEDFSIDILKVIKQYKDEIYELSLEEINRLCYALNIFYMDSKSETCKEILFDMSDLLLDKFKDKEDSIDSEKIESLGLMYLNFSYAYDNFSIQKYFDSKESIYTYLGSLYDVENGVFVRCKENKKDKDIDFSCQDVVMYVLCYLKHDLEFDASSKILADIYKNQLVNSGLVLSWPAAPDRKSAERHSNSGMAEETELEEAYFRLPSIATPESTELAPVFTKSISYNVKKETFSPGKNTFDSSKNMQLLYYILNSLM
ncbi:hypothetical protein IAI10_01830 [Clostridium sp. 19966]|uniref:hypothetical protein n=1 Tax=Clostridium sp. 19966 TaxID=2768166 RepID=UPI0028DF08EA|nr:hypothetical protein [Clostridium sp. 19966]MDT8715395.1 hypothetical protein [Clostridium sp. 19966]